MIWYNMLCAWYDMNDIQYICFHMVYNPDICFKSDMIWRKMWGVVFIWFDKWKRLGLHASENLSVYDGYERVHNEKENDYYVYHNTTMITIPIGCLTRAPDNASPTSKGAQEMCELSGGSIFARMIVCRDVNWLGGGGCHGHARPRRVAHGHMPMTSPTLYVFSYSSVLLLYF